MEGLERDESEKHVITKLD